MPRPRPEVPIQAPKASPRAELVPTSHGVYEVVIVHYDRKGRVERRERDCRCFRVKEEGLEYVKTRNADLRYEWRKRLRQNFRP